ncbi:hypothetical protein [Methanobrevibacter sp.]|uniref:hypothetical protein n=1 Tax=Methanobrevibacter sp. TaxID=66852 RepID=UPI003863CD33
MSNFDFLKEFDNTLWKLGNRIEKNVSVSPSGVKADATTFLEHILKELLNQAGLKYNSRKPFAEQVDAVFRSDLKMSNAYRERIKNAYNYRNKIHDEFDDIEKHEFQDAVQLHEKLFYIVRKFYRDYNENYDQYKGVPEFKPLEFDLSEDEVKIRDFNEIVDVKYDYCVVCGNPNHLNYSIYCHECSRKLENANNFISIRNAFGKDAQFTKEDLIEYGMAEGYVNQFIHSMTRENMLRVAGRFITFNNMYLEDYLNQIDNYIAVGELITRFKEDKISPADIKKSREYILGSRKEIPFYQFYKITDREIRKKFEKDLLATEDIWKSIDYTTITNKELERWYNIRLGNYKRGNVNESFVVFNQLLIKEYLKLKSEGILEGEIRKTLNVSDEVYGFWCEFDPEFEDRLMQIKIDLITQGINDKKTREEIIEYAGVTQKEYSDLFKVSDFKGNELSRIRNQELESRKSALIECLKHNDLETSCRMAKISVDDFYHWYDDMSSEFYIASSEVLMHNFLNQRRKGKTKIQSAEIIGIDYTHVERWFKRTLDICEDFKNRHVKVIADLIYEGFKNNKSKAEISQVADIKVERINNYLSLGKKGYGTFKKLYDYYEEEILPKELTRFLDEIKHKPLKKALEISELTQDEFEYCCSEGLEGNRKFKQFYEDYYNIKLSVFLNRISKGKSKSKALRNAGLTKEELMQCYELGSQGDERFAEFYQSYYDAKMDIYIDEILKGTGSEKALKNADLTQDEVPGDIDDIIFNRKLDIVTRSVKQDLTTRQAARKANVSVDDIYGWFLKGRSGDEKFKEFSKVYYDYYVNPGSLFVQKGISEDIPLSFILKKAKGLFNREDYEFWLENGFLKEAQEKIDNGSDEDNEPDSSIFKS